MKVRYQDDGWRLSGELWFRMERLLPAAKPHPLGCHRPRVSNRWAMDAIFLLLRTGMQWKALDATGICSSSSAYRRFREWIDAGVFAAFWRQGLLECEQLRCIDWHWLALDGKMTKAPLGGEKIGPNPTDRGKGGVKRSLLTDGGGLPLAVVVAPANRHDVTLVADTLAGLSIRPPRTRRARSRLCMDRGYDSRKARFCVRLVGWEPCLPRRKRTDAQRTSRSKRSARTPRWVVERSHSWLNRFRRLLVRWEKREDTYLGMLHFACALIAWRTALSK